MKSKNFFPQSFIDKIIHVKNCQLNLDSAENVYFSDKQIQKEYEELLKKKNFIRHKLRATKLSVSQIGFFLAERYARLLINTYPKVRKDFRFTEMADSIFRFVMVGLLQEMNIDAIELMPKHKVKTLFIIGLINFSMDTEDKMSSYFIQQSSTITNSQKHLQKEKEMSVVLNEIYN